MRGASEAIQAVNVVCTVTAMDALQAISETSLDAVTADRLLAGWLLAYDNARTRDEYGRHWRAWAAHCVAHGVDPMAATRGHVDAYARYLGAAGYAPATVALRLTAVASLYRYAVQEGWLPRNPCAHVRRPKVSQESPRLGLDRDQARAVLAAAAQGHSRDLALVTLLLLNGLRVSEAINAQVTDVATLRGHRVLTVVRKGGRVAQVPLAPRTVEALDRHSGGREAGPLILGQEGRALTRSGAARIVRRVAKAAVVEHRISPHSLRHTFVTLSLEAGVPLHVVQDGAGHADPRTTRRYDRARHSLDGHATYALTGFLAES